MLKSLDIVVLVSLFGLEAESRATFSRLADTLGSNGPAIHRAVARLVTSGLLRKRRTGSASPTDYGIHLFGMYEILAHATPYLMPVTLGAPDRGVATAHAGPDLRDRIRASTPYVWPYAEGTDHGPSIEPLDPCVPRVALQHPMFYRILALVDACRVGRIRERRIAQDTLRQLLSQGPEHPDG